MKRDLLREFQVILDSDQRRITLTIGQMKAKRWGQYMVRLEEIEQFMIDHQEVQLNLKCQMIDDTSTLYVLHLFKLAERYQWAGEKHITINCDLGLGKSYRYWLKEKLRRCFELDIRFTRLMAGRALL